MNSLELNCCKECLVKAVCEEACDKYVTEATEDNNYKKFGMSSIPEVIMWMNNTKRVEIIKKIDKCISCGHDKIVYIETQRDMRVCGYCEECELLYSNYSDDEFLEKDEYPKLDLLWDHHFNIDEEGDPIEFNKDGSMIIDEDSFDMFHRRLEPFKEIINLWNKNGYFN